MRMFNARRIIHILLILAFSCTEAQALRQVSPKQSDGVRQELAAGLEETATQNVTELIHREGKTNALFPGTRVVNLIAEEDDPVFIRGVQYEAEVNNGLRRLNQTGFFWVTNGSGRLELGATSEPIRYGKIIYLPRDIYFRVVPNFGPGQPPLELLQIFPCRPESFRLSKSVTPEQANTAEALEGCLGYSSGEVDDVILNFSPKMDGLDVVRYRSSSTRPTLMLDASEHPSVLVAMSGTARVKGKVNTQDWERILTEGDVRRLPVFDGPFSISGDRIIVLAIGPEDSVGPKTQDGLNALIKVAPPPTQPLSFRMADVYVVGGAGDIPSSTERLPSERGDFAAADLGGGQADSTSIDQRALADAEEDDEGGPAAEEEEGEAALKAARKTAARRPSAKAGEPSVAKATKQPKRKAPKKSFEEKAGLRKMLRKKGRYGGVAVGFTEPLEFLNGMEVAEQHIAHRQLAAALSAEEGIASLHVLSPAKGGEQWLEFAIPKRQPEELIASVRDLLPQGPEYILLEADEGHFWLMPQAVFWRPSTEGQRQRFKELVRRTELGEGRRQVQAFQSLLNRFSEEGGVPLTGGVRMRVSSWYKFFLFSSALQPGTRVGSVLALPSQYKHQAVHVVPRQEEGRLVLSVYGLSPFRLIHSYSRDADSGYYTLAGTVIGDKVASLPDASQKAFPAVDESRGYKRSELSKVTGLPNPLLNRLEKRGVVYLDSAQLVPGWLVALLAGASREADKKIYPISGLTLFLSLTRHAADRAWRVSGLPAIEQPGEQKMLARETVLEIVLTYRFKDKVEELAGPYLDWRAAAKRLKIKSTVLKSWPTVAQRVPVSNGFPLWVASGSVHRITHLGVEGLLEAEQEAVQAAEEQGKRVLFHAAQKRFPDDLVSKQILLYRRMFRAAKELGIPLEVLEHPLAPVQTRYIVPQGRLEEIFHEVDHPMAWTPRNIQTGSSYIMSSAARVLGFRNGTVAKNWLTGEHPEVNLAQELGHSWVSGADLIRVAEEKASSSGQEEGGLEETATQNVSELLYREGRISALAPGVKEFNLIAKAGDPAFVRVVRYEPGEGNGLRRLNQPGLFWVAGGSGQLELGATSGPISAGQIIYMPSDVYFRVIPSATPGQPPLDLLQIFPRRPDSLWPPKGASPETVNSEEALAGCRLYSWGGPEDTIVNFSPKMDGLDVVRYRSSSVTPTLMLDASDHPRVLVVMSGRARIRSQVNQDNWNRLLSDGDLIRLPATEHPLSISGDPVTLLAIGPKDSIEPKAIEALGRLTAAHPPVQPMTFQVVDSFVAGGVGDFSGRGSERMPSETGDFAAVDLAGGRADVAAVDQRTLADAEQEDDSAATEPDKEEEKALKAVRKTAAKKPSKRASEPSAAKPTRKPKKRVSRRSFEEQSGVRKMLRRTGRSGAVADGFTKPLEFLNGMTVVGQHIAHRRLAVALSSHEEMVSLHVLNSVRGRDQWMEFAVPEKQRGELFASVRGQLLPGFEYILLQADEGHYWLMPQSVFWRTSAGGQRDKLRKLLKLAEFEEGERQEKGLDRLLKQFSEEEGEPLTRGVRIRVTADYQAYLFKLALESGRYWSAYLTVPIAYRHQVIHVVPRLGEEGVVLNVYGLSPYRLVQSFSWNAGSRRYKALETALERRIAFAPDIAEKKLPQIEAARGYERSELAKVSGLPNRLLSRLESQGIVYLDSSNLVPGWLVALLAEASREVDKAEYPASALSVLLGLENETAVQLWRRSGLPSIRASRQRNLLSREVVLELVITRRFQDEVEKLAGPYQEWRAAGKKLSIGAHPLSSWPSIAQTVPVFKGFPLWVKYRSWHRLTHLGFEGLVEAEQEAVQVIQDAGKAVLWSAVQDRYQRKPRSNFLAQYSRAFQAAMELNIPVEELEHPLAPVQTRYVVPQERLDEVFNEVDEPTAWTTKTVLSEGWYALSSVRQALGLTEGALKRRVYAGALGDFKKIEGKLWVSGAGILQYAENQPSRSGLEENNLDARVARMQRRLGQERADVVLGPVYGLLSDYHSSRIHDAPKLFDQYVDLVSETFSDDAGSVFWVTLQTLRHLETLDGIASPETVLRQALEQFSGPQEPLNWDNFSQFEPPWNSFKGILSCARIWTLRASPER